MGDVEQPRNLTQWDAPKSERDTLQELEVALRPFTMAEGFIMQEPAEADFYNRVASPWIRTICETGFNAGHSATLLLLANSNATLYSFDMGQYPYSSVAVDFVKNKFPGRFFYTKGDSTQSVPAFAAANKNVHCDLSIVDGGHQLAVARADLA